MNSVLKETEFEIYAGLNVKPVRVVNDGGCLDHVHAFKLLMSLAPQWRIPRTVVRGKLYLHAFYI